MSTLTLNFEGWFQMRMATDPDPTDEKRGVSGYTFALAGEPDLDAKVHLQPDEPGVWQRKFGPGDDEGPNLPVGATSKYGPRVGVTVTSASIGKDNAPEYVGARVALLNAMILEHNGVLVRNDYFFIDPLRVRVFRADGTTLVERRDWVNPSDPSMPLWEATSAQLIRRQPTIMQSNSPMVAAATGLKDASNETCIQNRLERQANLKALRKKTKKGTAEESALTTRIEQLAIVEQWWNLAVGTFHNRPIDRRAHQLTLLFDGWNIGVCGDVYANKPGGDPSQEWPLSFWMGGWDGDALCAYIRGTWQIPLK